MLGRINEATEPLCLAERIKSEETVTPALLGEYVLCRYVIELFKFEEAMKRVDKTAIPIYRSTALKAGTEALRTANKYAIIKTETLNLIGVYYWLIGRQRKALQWWRKAIAEGQRLNDRLELSRTYFEVGRRLLEPKSKHKELDGIRAGEYLEKARDMFEEMDLQWDLDELEKLKLQLGT